MIEMVLTCFYYPSHIVGTEILTGFYQGKCAMICLKQLNHSGGLPVSPPEMLGVMAEVNLSSDQNPSWLYRRLYYILTLYRDLNKPQGSRCCFDIGDEKLLSKK